MSMTAVSMNRGTVMERLGQLSMAQKIGLGFFAALAVGAVIFFASWAQTPDYVAAYSDLSADDASAIVAYLKENNIPYQLGSNGSSVRVPAGQVNEVRLALAGEGIPGKGTVGFELFDQTNLAMTDFTQQVDYQRALEGELGRTISSLSAVQSARVHIVMPQESLYTAEKMPTTASVVLKLKPGASLNRQQVRAISNLVSAAVEGLTAENLSIVDTEGNVLTQGSGSSPAMAAGSTQMDAQSAYERDLEQRIQVMLENVLGPDKAVVRVAADMNWDQVETQRESYAPGEEGRVLRSSRTITEVSGSGSNALGGIPGTAANIPGTAPSYQTSISGTGGSAYQHYDTTSNYEISRANTHVISATGQLERLSVSVLVDNITDTTRLEAIKQATIAAAGIDAARGDQLTVNSIPFDRSFIAEQAAALEGTAQQALYLKLAQYGALGVALIILLFLARSFSRSLRPRPMPVIEELTPGNDLLAAGRMEGVEAAISAAALNGAAAAGPALDVPVPVLKLDDAQKVAAENAQMLRQLQLIAKNKPDTLAQIVQFWLGEEGGA